MWKFTGFDPNAVDKEGNQVVRLFLASDNGSRQKIDCHISLKDYTVADLIHKEYKQFNTVTELIELYSLKPREKSSNTYIRISSFKVGE